MQETWLLSEFCDKGNMDRALSGGRFHDKATSKPEMVCPRLLLLCQQGDGEIPQLQALPSMIRCTTGMLCLPS